MKSVGQYKILEKVGEGGMATVFRGIQPSLNRSVAIKFLSHKLVEENTIVERFNRESLIIARLSHPNIIHVIDRGISEEGMPYFVMDYVEGTNLALLMKDPGFDLNRKLDIIIQICKALSYAHKNGVVHRDIKPANILIDKEGNALVTDFGIAQFYENGKEEDALTKEGMVMGTLAYMSPEQRSGSKNVTAASDLYSLGVMMYELFAGKRPKGNFKGPSNYNASLPEELDGVVATCLEEEPGDRYKSADEVKNQLLNLLQGAHIRETQKERALESVAKTEDRFVLLDVIKETEYGGVYLFQDKTDDQRMVVKKCRSSRELLIYKKLMTTLKHPNIVNIYGISEERGILNIVMEYVSGGNLKERFVQKHPWQETIQLIRVVCEALNFAHKHHVIHGNLRPSNILIDDSGGVKLSDFGLEEHYPGAGKEMNWYSPPGEKRTVQADIYAVGAIVYEMIAGAPPVWKEGSPVPHEEFRLLPWDLWPMISKMMSRKRESRFRNFDEVIRAIDALLLEAEEANKTVTRSKVKSGTAGKVILVLVILLSTLLAGAYLAWRFNPAMKERIETLLYSFR
ncbi:MAG: serine/threonine protein kinase [Nitrospirae bacterium]|nr:serine/threonine protein kinase [Candidatus Manganitrophaceae bacterium]